MPLNYQRISIVSTAKKKGRSIDLSIAKLLPIDAAKTGVAHAAWSGVADYP